MDVSFKKDDHRESISPARSALHREMTVSWMLTSGLSKGPRRVGILRQSLARAARKAQACGVLDWWAHASVTVTTSA